MENNSIHEYTFIEVTQRKNNNLGLDLYASKFQIYLMKYAKTYVTHKYVIYKI